MTANIATFFVNQDASDNDSNLASEKSIQALHAEVLALRKEIQASHNAGHNAGHTIGKVDWALLFG